MMGKKNTIEFRCAQNGMRMTEQRKIIAKVLSSSKDHPDVEELYQRSAKIDKNISVATVYRTVKLFEDAGILEKHEFKDSRSRYEKTPDGHHDHLIDIDTGKVIEFQSEEIEKLQKKIAQQLGFDIIDHRLEIYAIKIKNKKY
jgi:Fur family transcriptional regulator, ferric uptake regulator